MESTLKNYKLTGMVFAATGVIMFSSKAIFVKKAFGLNVDPVSLLMIRMMLSIPFYLIIIIFLAFRKREKLNIGWKHVSKILFFGFIGYYMSSFLDFTGLQYISASLERLILFVYPTIVVIISAVFYKSKITSRQLIGIIVAYFGVFLIYFQRSAMDSHSSVWLGTLLVLGCALTYAIYLVGSGRLIPEIGSALYTSLIMVVSTIGVLIHFYFKGDYDLYSYPKQAYFVGIGLAIVATVIPSFMISEALKRIGSTKVAIIGCIGPISTIILASIFLGEKINAFQWLGSIIVISGVLLVNMVQTFKTRSVRIEILNNKQKKAG